MPNTPTNEKGPKPFWNAPVLGGSLPTTLPADIPPDEMARFNALLAETIRLTTGGNAVRGAYALDIYGRPYIRVVTDAPTYLDELIAIAEEAWRKGLRTMEAVKPVSPDEVNRAR